MTDESKRQESSGSVPSDPAFPRTAGANAGWHPTVAPTGPYRPKHKPLWQNTLTISGLYIVAMAVILLVTFFLFTVVAPTTNPYVDIVGYLVLPTILIAGVVLMPIGILFKSWRLKRKDPLQRLEFHLPRIDLTDPSQRRTAKLFLAGSFVLLPVVGVSAYHGYHYTDSAEFCAKACHMVMEPQATTYEYSPHARVACAECHIGEGASWFVKSKLSGTRQVIAYMRESYSRPIPPAIQNLRPARETCEHCHWPKKFFGAQLREIVHFASDEKNTPHRIDMLVKTGGGDETTGRAEGIHLHMALEGQIEYIATDEQLQDIPWVRYTDESGDVWVYRSDGRPSSDPPPEGTLRNFDCMDCHNRPAHKFRSPQEALDIYLEVQNIDTTLPFIKREAVEALVQEYPDTDTAEIRIGDHLTDFYEQNYPEIWENRRASVNLAVDRVREVYNRNIFPYMKVDWRTYPDNIGHLYSPGCFRCHDGKHVDQRGRPISHECSICHTFLNPVDKDDPEAIIRKGEFIHPYELPSQHQMLNCSECHTGGISPPPSCAECHSDVTAFRNGRLPGFERFDIAPEPMADLGCEMCHDLSQPTTIAAIDEMCMACHEGEEGYEGMLARWEEEVTGLMTRAATETGPNGQAVLQTLRKSGPMHNMEATRTIMRTLLESAEATAPTQPATSRN